MLHEKTHASLKADRLKKPSRPAALIIEILRLALDPQVVTLVQPKYGKHIQLMG